MEVGDSAALAAAMVVVINWLKASTLFPWLSEASSEVYKRRFAVIATGVAAFGFHLGLDAEARTITVSWPDAYTLSHNVLTWIGTVGFNQVFYGMVKRNG
jgi:Trk-type K+ transport system membrane component